MGRAVAEIVAATGDVAVALAAAAAVGTALAVASSSYSCAVVVAARGTHLVSAVPFPEVLWYGEGKRGEEPSSVRVDRRCPTSKDSASQRR